MSLGVTLAVFAAAEVAVRLGFSDELAAAAGGPPAAEDGAPTMRGNPYLLWEQAPGVRTEQGVLATINTLGLRGPEPVVPKPEGIRRLLATGDSSVYGFGVADDEPFISVAAKALSSGERPVEGHNAAIPGYSTYQTINLLEMRALDLEPDVLVVANLWSDNNFDSFVDRDLLSAYSSFEQTPRARVERLLQPLALYRLLHWQLVSESEQAAARKVGWTVGGGAQVGERRVSIDEYARNLDRIAQLGLSAGAELVFVVLPNQEDLTPNPNPQAWSVYRDAMRDTAARYGAPVIEAPSLFYEDGRGQGLFLDEMHPTASGHALLGDALAAALKPWADGGTVMVDGGGAPVPAYTDRFTYGDGGQGATAARASLSGRVHFSGSGPVKVEAVDLARSSHPVLGGVTLDGPGAFTLELSGGLSRVGFRVFADGTDHELFATPMDLSGGMQGLVLNLDAGQLQRD
mgnify:CR=1 FL=1